MQRESFRDQFSMPGRAGSGDRHELSAEYTGAKPMRTWNAAAIVGFSIVMAMQLVPVYSSLNGTYDAGYHLLAGLETLQSGTYSLGIQHPPLARRLTAFLPTLDGIEYRHADFANVDTNFNIDKLTQTPLEKQGDYWRTLTLGRLGFLPFIPLLIGFTWTWARELGGGTRAALVSSALVCFSPNSLAHASVIAVDFSLAATLLPACYYCYRWCIKREPRDAVLAGVFTGIAVASKYSALPYLGLTVILYWGFSGYRDLRDHDFWQRVRSHAPKQLALFCAAAFLILWASFSFRTSTMANPSNRPYERIDSLMTPGTTLHSATYWVVESVPLPLLDAIAGIKHVAGHAGQGHPSYLLGERRSNGSPLYFPIALLTKTTIPFLILIMIGLLMLPRFENRLAVYPALAALAILGTGMASPINIGIRHILPIYPMLALLAASVCARATRLGPVIALLLVWHAGEALYASPDFIPYFNQSVRGSEEKVLGDSNLDWGQDLYRLKQFMAEQRIDEISLSYFGTTSPEVLGIRSLSFDANDRPTGWVAASVTNLQGIYKPPLEWLAGHKPVAKIGRSIYAYNLP